MNALMRGELPFQREIACWSSLYLDQLGNYCGPDLREFGFPYTQGEWVPVDRRWSAMTEHKHALRIQEYWDSQVAV
jgi:hypothetical protein